MKLNSIVFCGIIALMFFCIIYYFNNKNTSYLTEKYHEFFMAGVNYNMCTNTGNPKRNEGLLKDTQTIFGHNLIPKGGKDQPLDCSGQAPMFMFRKNKCSPDCCPSTYSCSGGCVCTTEEQRKRIQGRR